MMSTQIKRSQWFYIQTTGKTSKASHISKKETLLQKEEDWRLSHQQVSTGTSEDTAEMFPKRWSQIKNSLATCRCPV